MKANESKKKKEKENGLFSNTKFVYVWISFWLPLCFELFGKSQTIFKHRDLLTRAVVYNSLARQLDSNILKARRLVTTAFVHSPTSDGCAK